MRRSALFFFMLILGAAALAGGLFLGSSSHQVTYQNVGRGIIAHYLVGQGTGYLQMTNTSTPYIVRESDFMPRITDTTTFHDGDIVSFIYDSGATTYIDQQSVLKTHLTGNAYTIVQITHYVGNDQTTYTSATYLQHPENFYQNNWFPLGAVPLAVGILLIAIAFLLPRKKVVTPEVVPTMGEHIGIAPLVDENDSLEMDMPVGQEDRVQITSSIPYLSLPIAPPSMTGRPTGQFTQVTNVFAEQEEEVQITSSIPYLNLPTAPPSMSGIPTGPLTEPPASTEWQAWSYADDAPEAHGKQEEEVQITSTIPYLKLPPRRPD